MPHQCVHCGRICPAGSREIIDGCLSCKSHFFFYIREDQLAKAREEKIVEEISSEDKQKIEKDIRELAGIVETNAPVVLDFESIRATSPGKYEIDIVNLFKKGRPLIYKLEEGKYIIDLATTFAGSIKELNNAKNFEN